MDANPIERLSLCKNVFSDKWTQFTKILRCLGDEVIDLANPQIQHDQVFEVPRCNHAGVTVITAPKSSPTLG